MNHNSTIQFIHMLYPDQDFIPLHAPIFKGNEKKYLNECIDTTFVSSVGKFVDQSEQILADYLSVKKAVAVSNGTSALHVALNLCGVKQGDEVLTQALTFVGTVNPISYCKAIPVFIDVSTKTLGMCAEKLESFLTENTSMNNQGECVNKKTQRVIRACIPVHIFGFAAHIDEIVKICRRFNIKVIEDAAEAMGSEYKGKKLGTFGDIGTFSFNGNKIITCGGGGMLVTNDNDLGLKAKHMTTTAKVPHKWNFFHDETGYNYRMPNINAAILCAQMEQLELFLAKKEKLANLYHVFFNTMDIQYIVAENNCKPNYWLNTILLKDLAERNSFLEITNQNGIQTRPVWDLMNTLPMYTNCQSDDLTNSKMLSQRIVNVPSSVNYQF